MICGLFRNMTGKGYGVQSPFAFHFITQVVNERMPYYGIQDLHMKYGESNREGEVSFRISNWLQPVQIIDLFHDTIINDYVKSGCLKSRFLCETVDAELCRTLVLIDVEKSDMCESIISAAKEWTVMIVFRINEDKCKWKSIVDDERASITIDIQKFGIVLFRKKTFKQKYKIKY
jgi:hypothetical protein